jgi:hypothetical protein
VEYEEGIVMSGKAPRARKTKTAVASASAPAPSTTETITNDSTSIEPVATTKAKGRAIKKNIKVVAIITPNGIEGNFTPEPRKPLIVHLPFSSSEVKFSDPTFRYDPSPPPQPVPYEGDIGSYFQVNSEVGSEENQIGVEQEGWKMALDSQVNGGEAVSTPASSTIAPAPVSSTAAAPVALTQEPTSYIQENFQRIQLLTCYATKPGKVLDLPSTTNVSCFWCSNQFTNAPCFLPVKEESAVYHVYGNFCTPQCGLAHLLNEHLDSHVRWERMALLHRMYKTTVGRLYPAPPRDSLIQFGGIYTYEKFREIINEGKIRVDIHKPPMVSILGTLDTKPIDFYDSSLQNTFTQGFSMDRFKAWSEQGGALRLKRSKPLKDRDSTLDACIQISVKRG